MSKFDFGNSFIIPLGNGAWEINPLFSTFNDELAKFLNTLSGGV